MATSTFPVGGTESGTRITVTVNSQSLGVFDSKSGGAPSAKSVKHRPGGRGPEVAYVSLKTFGDLTLTRVYQSDRDWELHRGLVPLCGSVSASCTEQPLDGDGNNYGNPKTWTGVLLDVDDGKAASDSDNARMWTLKMSVTGQN